MALVMYWHFSLQSIQNSLEENLKEAELGQLAEYIEPNNQERLAQILHPGDGSMMMSFLRAKHRENIWAIGNDILQDWLVKNPEPGNKLVSTLVCMNEVFLMF